MKITTAIVATALIVAGGTLGSAWAVDRQNNPVPDVGKVDATMLGVPLTSAECKNLSGVETAIPTNICATGKICLTKTPAGHGWDCITKK